jgi:anti-sigma factor RsiW
MSPVEYLSCREFVELVTLYLDDALSTEDRARFQWHLDRCEGCAVYVEQIRLTAELSGSVSLDGLPQAAEEELLRSFADWHRSGT